MLFHVVSRVIAEQQRSEFASIGRAILTENSALVLQIELLFQLEFRQGTDLRIGCGSVSNERRGLLQFHLVGTAQRVSH